MAEDIVKLPEIALDDQLMKIADQFESQGKLQEAEVCRQSARRLKWFAEELVRALRK
jgi:hypothetical protein